MDLENTNGKIGDSERTKIPALLPVYHGFLLRNYDASKKTHPGLRNFSLFYLLG